jgi:PAS domain S-box-containing protein
MPSTPSHETSRAQRDELTTLLLHNITDYAIMLLDPGGQVATWDVGAQRLLGYGAEEILGRHFSLLFTPEDVADGRPARELEEARRCGSAEDENWLVRRDGSRMWVTGSSSALWDDAGTLRGFAKIVRDLSERKQWEDEVARREQRFRVLLEHIPDALVLNDAAGTITDVSPALERLLGYRAAEIVGRYAGDLIHPDDLARVAATFAHCLEHGGSTGPVEYRLRHKDGSWRWVEGIGTNLLDEPTVQAVVINAHDLTRRKAIEDRLATSEERFRLLVQHSSDVITVLSAEGMVLYQSASFEQLLGYAPAAPLDQHIAAPSLVHPDDQPAVDAMVRQVRAQPASSVRAEYRLRHRDGNWRWIEVVATNCLDDPRIGGIIANSRDITARKAYEERKDEFISIAAHELRSPLTALLGFTELLGRRAERDGNPAYSQSVARIAQQADRLSTLVQELLDVSRLQTGNLAFYLQPVVLNTLISEFLAEVRHEAPRHRLVLEQMDAVIVRADAHKTTQVLRNLLLNAIKYSPAADRVIIRVTREGDVGRVSVQDFGVGIPVEEQDRVFERFVRVQATRDRFPGLGLGLYIAKGIVEGQEGTIAVESCPGVGSTFSVTLPLWDAEVPRAPA